MDTSTSGRFAMLAGAGFFSVLLSALAGSGCSRRPAPPNIVVVVVDSLRADALGCYGAERSVSPNIDRIAAEGIRFERALAQASWNLPSLSSLLSSTLPHEHGQGASVSSPTNVVTLAEALAGRGYQTAAFVETKRWPLLDRGFGSITNTSGPLLYGDPTGNAALKTVKAALDWIPAARDKPFFLLIHTYETHNFFMGKSAHRAFAKRERPEYFGRFLEWEIRDTDPPVGPRVIADLLAARPEDVAFARSLYRGAVLETDAAIGLLDERLKHQDLARNTVLVVTSTNGESFRPDLKRVHHGGRLHDDLLHVPLIVRWPGRIEPGTARSPVALIDVAPTLVAMAGETPEASFRGRALLALRKSSLPVIGKARFVLEEQPTVVVAEESALRVLASGQRDASSVMQSAIYSGGAHLIDDGTSVELYDIQADPNEEQNVAGSQSNAVQALCTKLRALTQSSAPQTGSSGDQTLEMLQSLGYVTIGAQTEASATDQPPTDHASGCERALSGR